MLGVEEIVEVRDYHECKEVHDDVEHTLRSRRDHDVVEDGHEDYHEALAEAGAECHYGVLKTPDMVHNELHLAYALPQLGSHGDVHHDAGYEPSESHVHFPENQGVPLNLASLVENQPTDGDLEDPNDQGLRNDFTEALIDDFSSLQDLFGELYQCFGLPSLVGQLAIHIHNGRSS